MTPWLRFTSGRERLRQRHQSPDVLAHRVPLYPIQGFASMFPKDAADEEAAILMNLDISNDENGVAAKQHRKVNTPPYGQPRLPPPLLLLQGPRCLASLPLLSAQPLIPRTLPRAPHLRLLPNACLCL